MDAIAQIVACCCQQLNNISNQKYALRKKEGIAAVLLIEGSFVLRKITVIGIMIEYKVQSNSVITITVIMNLQVIINTNKICTWFNIVTLLQKHSRL